MSRAGLRGEGAWPAATAESLGGVIADRKLHWTGPDFVDASLALILGA